MEDDDLEKLLNQWAVTEDDSKNHSFSISPGVTIEENDVSWISPSFKIICDEYSDSSYGVHPEFDNPTIYTSHEQREQHDKYPALKKAWEDYLAMYNITKGNPPNVD